MSVAALAQGSVARLTCRAVLVGGNGPVPRYRAEQLVDTELPRALAERLTAAADDAVHIVGKLRIRVRARLDEDTASLAARLADAVVAAVVGRLGDSDVDQVIYPSTAAYLAACLTEMAQGTAAGRWWFAPLSPLTALSPGAAATSVHRLWPELMPAIWSALHAAGKLHIVLQEADDVVADAAWQAFGSSPAPEAAPVGPDRFALARLAAVLAAHLGWEGDAAGPDRSRRPPVGPAVAQPDTESAQLARAAAAVGTDFSWSDPAALADALLRALAALTTADQRPEPRAGALTSGWDWVDVSRLRAGIMRLANQADVATGSLPGPGLAEAQGVREVLKKLIETKAIEVAPGRPGCGAVELWASLAAHAPDLATAPAAHAAITELATELAAPTSAFVPTSAFAPASAFAPTFAPVPAGEPLAGAGALLLVRALVALRVPQLCSRHGLDISAVLSAVFARCGGAEPLAAILTGDRADPVLPPASALQSLVSDVADLLVAQRAADPDRFSWTLVPFGTTTANLFADAQGRVLAGVLAPGETPLFSGETPQGSVRPEALCNALDLLRSGHRGAGPAVELALDLLTLIVVGEWTRWLRGFPTATARFVIDGFLRRPGHLHRPEPGVVTVKLESRPHDVVLELSEYLAPIQLLQPLTPRGVRRIEFRIQP